LLLARRHIEKDTAKVFEAVVTAMAADQAEDAAYAAADAATHQDDVDAPEGAGDEGET
jgi:hypothetical protein